VNQILREVISDELTRISDIDDRIGIVTVTGVETTQDLRQAMVFFDSLTPRRGSRSKSDERRSNRRSTCRPASSARRNSHSWPIRPWPAARPLKRSSVAKTMTTSNGLLLVDKPRGLTSHDVVARVRRILHEKKVGHAGTLDPMATGLLVLAVGPSTRLLRFAQSETKRYAGAVKFGVATDSLDADGAVVDEQPVPTMTRESVQDAASTMLGSQLQTPPMVSAIKVDGQRLHELARRGLEVEREARAITVTSFTLAPSDDDSIWRFDVVCSVGPTCACS